MITRDCYNMNRACPEHIVEAAIKQTLLLKIAAGRKLQDT